jgi:hypothetical protein
VARSVCIGGSVAAAAEFDRMSHRSQQAIAFAVAILLTMVSWEQVMRWKAPVARWKYVVLTPLPIALGASDVLAVFLFLVQWPMLPLAFCAGLRRWKLSVALAVVGTVYILLAITALIVIKKV